MLHNKPRGNILICEYERKKIRSIKYCLWQQIVDHWWQKISGTYIYGLCFLKVIKKVALSKHAVVKLKGGFLMKSFIMNAPLWVEHLQSSFGFAVAPTKKWWWRCSTHKDAFIINYPLFSSAKKNIGKPILNLCRLYQMTFMMTMIKFLIPTMMAYLIILIQVNLCQKHLFSHQLTHNMTIYCSLIYKFNTWKLQAQNMGRTCSAQKLFFVFVLAFRTIFAHNMFSPCSELVVFMYWTGKSMNNRLSYCGLVDPRISASDKDLPVR